MVKVLAIKFILLLRYRANILIDYDTGDKLMDLASAYSCLTFSRPFSFVTLSQLM